MVFNKKENKVALITGASRLKGIGAAICQRLAADGIDIFFTYWSKYDDEQPWGFELNEPELLKNEIEKHNVRCFKKEIDLARPENINKLLDEVVDKIGIPSILINNAAYSTSSSFKDIDNELLDKHYYINLRLTILLSAKFARLFDKKEGGRIISLTSGQFKGPVNFSHLIKNKIRKELVKLKLYSVQSLTRFTPSLSHMWVIQE
jgi:3-oxoacyl-[acyl-carrier protein] reductase